jgi:hypothetical protein
MKKFFLLLMLASTNLLALDCTVNETNVTANITSDQSYLKCPMFISLPSYNREYIKVLSLSTVTPKNKLRCHYKYKQESIDLVISCRD